MGILPDWMIRRDVKIEPFDDGEKKPGRISSGISSYGYDLRLGYKLKIFTNTHRAVIDPKSFDPRAFVDVDLTPLPHQWERHFDDMWHPRWWKCCGCGLQAHDLYENDGVVTSYELEPNGELIQAEPCPAKPVSNHALIPPNSFALAESIEYMEVPRDCLVLIVGKSTLARCGLNIICTPAEPMWKGRLTIEIANTTTLPAKVYPGEGICQCVFLRTDGYSEAAIKAIGGLFRDTHGGNEEHPAYFLEGHFEEKLRNGTCRVSYADKAGIYQAQPGLVLPRVRGEEM